MSFDYLVDHAIKNVWGAPRQDRQVIIHPAPLSPKHGEYQSARLHWRQIPLPDTHSRWYLYQIGATHPMVLNLFSRCYEWVALSQACEKQDLLANVYTVDGIQFPLFDTYYAYTADQNLVLAVRSNTKIAANLDEQDIYLRIYSNAYYQSERANNLTNKIKTLGNVINSNPERNVLKVFYDQHKALQGHTWLMINGVSHEQFDETLMPVGTYVEVIYDASVKKVIQLDIKDLLTFNSTLDDKLKYLVHYNGADDGKIDYQDDIDFYVQYGDQPLGLYYHKNHVDAVRQLTHRDYSVPTTYIARYAEVQQKLHQLPQLDPIKMQLQLIFRHAGVDRPLVYEANRIHELYKMQDQDVLRAMVGIDAVVDVWRADHLESSSYPLVMRSRCHEITNRMVEQAYGYNAIGRILADTPSKVVDNGTNKTVKVPYRLQFGCTAYEYGSDGLLIGVHHHVVGNTYTCKNDQTYYVELIAGLGSAFLHEIRNERVIPDLRPFYTHRVYMATQVGGVRQGQWKDVTDSDLYRLDEQGFEWLSTSVTQYPLVRSDKRFLARDLELNVTDGLLSFHLSQKTLAAQGEIVDEVMQIPMGQLDIFLNGRSLIKDLDYFVDFPKVVIVNKKYLKRPIASEKQHIHIRYTGFASKQFEMTEEGDRGFIEHGLLSHNNKYHLRDDKVQRVIVDGKLYTKDELSFSEHTSGVSVVNVSNGLPYMVKDLLIPVSSHTTSDTYTLYQQSRVIDQQVSEYLTKKIPEPERNAPSAITEKYPLYSPFCNKLIFDLKYERLVLPQQKEGFTRQQILEICKPYEALLKFDPSQSLREQDRRYVIVHPHGQDTVIDLNKQQYQFMHQVIQLYTQPWVELSEKVRMVE